MSEIKYKFIVDGTEWKATHLERLAYERNLHALHQMKRHGFQIEDDGHILSDDDIDYLTMEKAWEVSVNTRANYSGEEVIELYADSMKRSDELWRQLAFDQNKPMKVSHCNMLVEGLSVEQFMAIMQIMQDDIRVALASHPEHFAGSITQEKLLVVEPFGMYGTPTLCTVMVCDASELGPQIQKDQDPTYTFSMAGRAYLPDGTTEINSPYHQFKPTDDGFEAKLAVYWPENTPDEIVSGHCLHLAMEFYEGLKQIIKMDKK